MLTYTKRFLSPKEIVDQLDIKSGSRVADFGSGAGDFSIAIAKEIGISGKVYSIDVQESAHQSLRSKYKINSLTNIEIVLADLEKDSGSCLPDQSVDMVLMHNVLFQVSNKKHLIQEAFRILNELGKLFIIAWDINSPVGPPKSMRLPDREIVSLVQNNGFELDKKINVGKYKYGYLFNKV
ncbi:MAG: hypothetical protein RLZZ223_110 [Candidatus Parcubacteria bacterium]|jgi:ubiquinone/menaquinone biosynthesis C-methylase UbiE